MLTRSERNEEKQKEIIKEENREIRKKIVISCFKITIIIILLSITFYLYTTYISSKIIDVKEERIINEKLPTNFNGLKIIQISDIHYGSTIFIKDIKKLVKLVNQRTPDLVVFTGDLINKDYKLNSKEQEKLITELKKIKTTIGKYAIMGEEDSSEFNTIMNQSNFTILNNSYDLIYKDNNIPILLIGLNNSKKNEDIDSAYEYFNQPTHNSNIYTITLLHKPDTVNEILEKYPTTDLFLAGHSHNGQINIPYIGGLVKKEGSQQYINEFYQINNSRLYISSGIGTNGNGFRLFCRPSINFFRLSSN
ncbi:MAG: metallophosphoesterase [Candidatus Faecimonas sp.]|nr:metallophosphoesterase [Mycoplasmatota bacterium]MDY2908471.1 metallophosphoesterase [Candidatus Faecimonas sp.]